MQAIRRVPSGGGEPCNRTDPEKKSWKNGWGGLSDWFGPAPTTARAHSIRIAVRKLIARNRLTTHLWDSVRCYKVFRPFRPMTPDIHPTEHGLLVLFSLDVHTNSIVAHLIALCNINGRRFVSILRARTKRGSPISVGLPLLSALRLPNEV